MRVLDMWLRTLTCRQYPQAMRLPVTAQDGDQDARADEGDDERADEPERGVGEEQVHEEPADERPDDVADEPVAAVYPPRGC